MGTKSLQLSRVIHVSCRHLMRSLILHALKFEGICMEPIGSRSHEQYMNVALSPFFMVIFSIKRELWCHAARYVFTNESLHLQNAGRLVVTSRECHIGSRPPAILNRMMQV